MENLINLVDAKKSPLSRIMSIFNDDEPSRKKIENNICATHIGKGYVISVAHSLFSSVPFYHSLSELFYQNKVVTKLSDGEKLFVEQKYVLDTNTNKRYLQIAQNEIQKLITIFSKIDLPLQYCEMYKEKICKPFLIFNFEENEFYFNDNNKYFLPNNYFFESVINKHTFIIELELLEYDYKYDFALYKFTDKFMPLANIIPSIEVDFSIHDNNVHDLYCIQGATVDNLGRMVNKAIIEGYIDQFSNLGNYKGKAYFFEGLRYLIKGYFRFGSSGAPYVYFNNNKSTYVVNAIQSEACPQQLLINNNRDGNAQYINAIATPLINVEQIIKKYFI